MFRLGAKLAGTWLAVTLGLAVAPARADEFVSIDFPVNGKKIASAGLTAPPHQVATPDGIGYAEVSLRPIRKDTRVFLTFIFKEDGGKGLAVFWSGDVSGRQVTISENIAEGIVGLNRRTVLLPEEVTEEAGHLYVMGRQDSLVRLRIDWCDPSSVLVAADQERPALLVGGTRLLDREVTGQAVMTPPDAWFGRVLDAALQDGVTELSDNLELVVPLKGASGRVRLRAKFLGLPLGKAVRVWINGKLAGRIQPALPSLTDSGYVRRGKRTTYAGWREGAVFLEEGTLREGENSVIFESPGTGVYLSGAAMEIEPPLGDDAPDEPAPEATPSPTPLELAPAEPAPSQNEPSSP